MDIKIVKENSFKSIHDENSTRWKLFTEKNNKIILFQVVFGIVFIVLGILDENQQYNNINITLSFGIAGVLLAGIYSLQTYMNKNRFDERIQQYANRHKLNPGNIEIHITNESIKYKDFELTQELKWSIFSHFKLYHGYLFLIIENSFLSSIVIDKKLFKEIEFIELYDFVSKKLIEKK